MLKINHNSKEKIMKLINHLFKKHLISTSAVILFIIFFVVAILPNISKFGPARADTVVLSPNNVGNYDQWAANTGTKVDAVASDDIDATYIFSNSNNKRQSFTFSGAGVPAGSIISFVKVEVVAKTLGDDKIKILAEQGSERSNRDEGSGIVLSASYTTYDRTMKKTHLPILSGHWMKLTFGL